MQKNLYFHTVVMRQNLAWRGFLNFFLTLSSYPRLIIEVFIRKNFGERYFSLSAVITAASVLIAYPLIKRNLFKPGYDGFGSYGERYGRSNSLMGNYAIWYLFIAAFLFFSYMRWKEVKRNPSVYDFAKYSKYAGDIHPIFFSIKLNKKPFTIRQIEIFIEPLAAFLVGMLLYLIGQSIGIVIAISAIIYALSYAGAYKNGDDFILDKIDEMIMNEETSNAFNTDEENPRGVKFYMKKPAKEEFRQKLADSIIEESQPRTEKTYAE